MPRRSNATANIAAILLVIALLPAGYMGAYYLMLDNSADSFDSVLFALGGEKRPVYRVRNEFVADIFWPAHQIDRSIRPAHWRDDLGQFDIDEFVLDGPDSGWD